MIFEIVFDPATFSLDESRKYSVELTVGTNRTGPAGQAAPPGPVRFGPQLVLLNIFLTHLEKMQPGRIQFQKSSQIPIQGVFLKVFIFENLKMAAQFLISSADICAIRKLSLRANSGATERGKSCKKLL